MVELAKQRKKCKTQKEALHNEITDLKRQTDVAIHEAQEQLNKIERLQQQRKTSGSFFVTVVPHMPAQGLTS